VVDDQASKLRALMRQARQTTTVAIASGKGGVGKSNVALNLSLLLAGVGCRVALVDADLGLANLDLLADVDVRANLADVVDGSRAVQDVVVELAQGVQFVPGASGLARLTELSSFERARLLEELRALEEDSEVIVVDTAAGIGPGVMQFAGSADRTMIVTTPEPPAVADAYAVVKVLCRQGFAGQLSLLTNRAASRQAGRSVAQRLASVSRKFLGKQVFDAGYVPEDPRVPQAVLRRKPFVLAYPQCRASRCLAAVANKLFQNVAVGQQRQGFFRRVADWFA